MSRSSLPDKVNRYNPLQSVGYALEGIKDNFKREPNISFQFGIGLIAISVSLYLGYQTYVWLHLAFMSLTISVEMLNTAFENLCDLVEPRYSLTVKSIKDGAAGAVLFAALSWLVVIFTQLVVIFTPL